MKSPRLTIGRVYRTRELSRWGKNPSRLAKRLVREGKLVRVGFGLWACPREGRFGQVLPDDAELVRAFLDDTPFVFTGSDRWNALGLGTTAVFTTPLVYNLKRSGRFVLAGRPFEFRRFPFPTRTVSPEWYVVDLFENAAQAATSREDLAKRLRRAMQHEAFSARRLRDAAQRYGTKATQAAVESALTAAGV
jgi:hypothetical protein